MSQFGLESEGCIGFSLGRGNSFEEARVVRKSILESQLDV